MLPNVLLLFSGLSAATMAYLAWRKRTTNGIRFLIGFLVAISLWSFSHLLEHFASGALVTFFEKLAWIGLTPAAFFWFAFVVDYTERGHLLHRRNWVLLFLWPAILMTLIWLPDLGRPVPFVWSQINNEQGALFWSHVVLSYGLLAVGSALLLSYTINSPRPFRNQGIAVTLGVGAAWAGSIVSLFGNYHFHALPVGFTVMAGCLLWAMLVPGLGNISPVARRTVMQTISAGVIAFDRDWQITTINPAARQMLQPEEPVVGRSVPEILGDNDAILEKIDDQHEPDVARTTITVDDRVLEVQISPMQDARYGFVGYVLLFYDITDRKRQQEQLEQQNERLENFASIISHDLRNPLAVASGRLKLARECPEERHFDAISRTHSRMDDLIDDVLTLVRNEEQAIESEPIQLSNVAEQCWRNIPTDHAELEVGSDLTFEADRRYLQQLLENLIGNAVEHGGEDVTITVGQLPDGFYFEDDGVGIPNERHSEIFEPGYSTGDTGTGLGLNIVEEIATAHNWEIDVTESSEGGTRFEFTGVETIEFLPPRSGESAPR